jgi:ferredoxin
MASLNQRYSDNIQGKFYVDRSCIDCGLCSEIAPDNFCRSKQQDHDIVYKQPCNEEEEENCMEAFDACPVEAIGIESLSKKENIWG